MVYNQSQLSKFLHKSEESKLNYVNPSLHNSIEILKNNRHFELAGSYFSLLVNRLIEKNTILDSLKLSILYCAETTPMFPIIQKSTFNKILNHIISLTQDRDFSCYVVEILKFQKPIVNLQSFFLFDYSLTKFLNAVKSVYVSSRLDSAVAS